MKSSKKNIIGIILGCIVVCIVIAVIVFLFQADKFNKATDTPTPTPQNSYSPSPSDTQTENLPNMPIEGLNQGLMESKDPFIVKLNNEQVKLLDNSIEENAFAIVYFPDKSVASFEVGEFVLDTKVFHEKNNYIAAVTIVADSYVKSSFLLADKDQTLHMLDTVKNLNTPDLSLMIINRQNPITKEQAEGLKNLEQLTNPWYVIDDRKDLFILPSIKQALEKLLKAADLQDASLNMHVASAYRSYTEQKQSFDHWVNKRVTQENMTYEQAYEYTAGRVAIPGCSEHHNGLTLDIIGAGYMLDESSKDAPFAQWLRLNSYKHGFHIRYEEGKEQHTLINLYEPWHIRYVGFPTAYYLYINNLCMEEFYNILVINGYVDFEFDDISYRYIYTKSDNIYIDPQIMQIEEFSVIASGVDGYVLLGRIKE